MKKWIAALLTLWVSTTVFAFPITVAHKHGTLTLTKKPQRIVSVGYTDHDDILSFGVKPIALRDWYGAQPNGVWPWAQDELGESTPLVLTPRILDYETIAALKPDLIIGITSAMDAKEYKKLNAIAPTLAQPLGHSDYGIPWDIRHLTIGKVLGFEARAIQEVNALQEKLDGIKMAHPEFKGKSAAVAFYYSKQPGAYASNDLRSQFLIDLGFVIPEEVDKLAGDAFYASFSEERLDILDLDVVIWLGTEEKIDAESNSVFRTRMPFYKNKREYFTGDLLGGAFSFFSYLSIQYIIDEMVPEISRIAIRE